MSKGILIVEDEIILAMDLKYLLQDLGYEVEGFAFSGHDAILQARDKAPALVLVDIKLHGYMDGIEAARYIKEHLGIPIVFITGNTDEATRTRALSVVSPEGYLEKPVNLQRLQSTIKDALERAGGTAEPH